MSSQSFDDQAVSPTVAASQTDTGQLSDIPETRSMVEIVAWGLSTPDVQDGSMTGRYAAPEANGGIDTHSPYDEASVRSAMRSDDPRMRRVAIHALARRNVVTERDVRHWMLDPHPTVRLQLAEMLGRFEIPGALNAALALLDDGDPLVAETAAWTLGEIDTNATTVSALTRAAVDHDDPLVRESAVAALGAIGSEDGKGAVLQACSDKPAVRRRAVLALAAFDGEDIEAALTKALDDRDWQVRQAAEDLLG